jgi:hypothetical protein
VENGGFVGGGRPGGRDPATSLSDLAETRPRVGKRGFGVESGMSAARRETREADIQGRDLLVRVALERPHSPIPVSLRNQWQISGTQGSANT